MIEQSGGPAPDDHPGASDNPSNSLDGAREALEPGAGLVPRFHVVVLGTGPVGKTSLINALLGRSAGETGPTLGTTRAGQSRTYTVEGIEGALLLTDTPGLGEAGAQGSARQAEALELAASADLVLFVVDHDLTRADRQTVLELTRRGQRLLVALNKRDRLVDEDREAILSKLRERLEGLVPPEDVVAIAAHPNPVTARTRNADGTTETVLEVEPPELEALEARVATVLEHEGDALRAGRLMLRARRREQAERARIARRRHDRTTAIIERHQWLAAATAFANPVLALGPMAAGAVQLRMLSEMAAAHEVRLSPESIEMVGRQMAQSLIKLGVADAAASLLAGVFKFNPIGFAAGGAVQAVTMAYLTRLTGDSFREFLERGQTWGEGGMRTAMARHLESTRKSEWFAQFALSALSHLFRR